MECFSSNPETLPLNTLRQTSPKPKEVGGEQDGEKGKA